MQFGTINGLYLLYFLVPFILLYLIKAKPMEITIPSLLFFAGDKTVKKYNSFLRKFLLRLLFFLQLAVILLLAFSAANPIITVPMDAYSQNSVVIIDNSASMSAKEAAVARIDSGKEALLKLVKGRISIILAEENPVVLAVNISSSKARALITNLGAKDTTARIDGAIILADNLLGKDKGSIIVYSDFLLAKEDDILSAKKLVEANDKKVILVTAGSPQKNLGFVELSLNKGKGEAFIKNFGDKNKVTDVNLLVDKKQQESKRIEITANSIEPVSFDIPKGEISLELSEKDSLTVDDKAYIINPYEPKINILFITNNKEDNPLLDALQANSQFKVDITLPPVIPDLNYNVVVIDDVNKEMLLPNTFRDIKKYKDKGGQVILASQENIEKLDFQGLLGFSFGQLVNNDVSNDVSLAIINEDASIGENLNPPPQLSHYYTISACTPSSIIASACSLNGSNTCTPITPEVPLFIMEDNLFYYGIIDKYSGFKDQINYPLFWNDLISSMLGRENLAQFNFKTGDILINGGNTSSFLDKTGIYEANGKKIAVNLLNEQESNIFRESTIKGKAEFEPKYEKINLDLNIDNYLLLAAIILLAFELFYIKRRGDL